MKNTKPSLLIAALLGLFSVSCGDNFDDTRDAAPACVYNGVRHTPEEREGWKAKDGCNVCYCSIATGQVMCSNLICGDGGASDGLPSADATSDQLISSDALIPTADTKGPDFGRVDAPLIDASADVSADGPVSDGRLD